MDIANDDVILFTSVVNRLGEINASSVEALTQKMEREVLFTSLSRSSDTLGKRMANDTIPNRARNGEPEDTLPASTVFL